MKASLLVRKGLNPPLIGPARVFPSTVRVTGAAADLAVLPLEPAVVPNVHEFPGHIACDTASNSEVVVPILKDGNLIGVLDIDSPEFDRFGATDAKELEKFAAILSDAIP